MNFGAIGDSKTSNTRAINEAIAYASQQHLGKVVIPPGIYLSSTIKLKSNLQLELLAGATIIAIANFNEFIEQSWAPGGNYSLFSADSIENIAIIGSGTIDGSAELHTDNYYSTAPYEWTSVKKKRPTPLVDFRNSRHCLLDGVTIQNASCWSCQFFMSDFIWVTRVTVQNSLYAGNSDGKDFVRCRDVSVNNCHIETGDDALTFKTNVNTRSTERVAVSNCILSSNCAAFRIGAETWFPFRDISFSNSIIYKSNRGIDITSQVGAVIERVVCSGITINTNNTGNTNMNRPIHLELRKGRSEWVPNPPLTRQLIGKIRDIQFSNIIINTDGPILLTVDGGKLQNISFNQVSIRYPWIEDPVAIKDISDPDQSSNYNPEARVARAAFVIENAENFQLNGFEVHWPTNSLPADFIPKYRNGILEIDPRLEKRPDARFSVLWANQIVNGVIDIPFAIASHSTIKKYIITNSKIKIRD